MRRSASGRARTSRCSRTFAPRPERPDTIALREELSAALAEISPTQARVVVLKDALDLSFEEVAALTEIPVGTAKCYAHAHAKGCARSSSRTRRRDRLRPIRAGRDRVDPPAPRPFLLLDEVVELDPGDARRRAQARNRRGLRGSLSRATRSCPA